MPHTPGPWVVKEIPATVDGKDMTYWHVDTPESSLGKIATIWAGHCEKEQGRADACLISAAPELLEALKGMMSLSATVGGPERMAAINAIDKAEGKK